MNTYGNDEQVTGFLTCIQDQVDTPFEAFVLGTAVWRPILAVTWHRR